MLFQSWVHKTAAVEIRGIKVNIMMCHHFFFSCLSNNSQCQKGYKASSAASVNSQSSCCTHRLHLHLFLPWILRNVVVKDLSKMAESFLSTEVACSTQDTAWSQSLPWKSVESMQDQHILTWYPPSSGRAPPASSAPSPGHPPRPPAPITSGHSPAAKDLLGHQHYLNPSFSSPKLGQVQGSCIFTIHGMGRGHSRHQVQTRARVETFSLW